MRGRLSRRARAQDCYLAYFLTELAGATAIVFARTCDGARKLALMLRNLGFDALPIHGQMSQPKRLGALNKFKAGERSILVATGADAASRALGVGFGSIKVQGRRAQRLGRHRCGRSLPRVGSRVYIHQVRGRQAQHPGRLQCSCLHSLIVLGSTKPRGSRHVSLMLRLAAGLAISKSGTWHCRVPLICVELGQSSRATHVRACADVASRGLDIPSVDVVVNYDLPNNAKEYVHRVGRTARAGRSGRALTLVTQCGPDSKLCCGLAMRKGVR